MQQNTFKDLADLFICCFFLALASHRCPIEKKKKIAVNSDEGGQAF